MDFGEYLSFKSRDVEKGCSVESYQDLSGYVYAESTYSDEVIDGLLRAAKANLLEGETLISLGITRTGSSSEGSSFFFTIQRCDGELKIQELSSSSNISFRPYSSRKIDR